MSEAYGLYYLNWDSQILGVNSSLDGKVVHTFLGHFDLGVDFWCHF